MAPLNEVAETHIAEQHRPGGGRIFAAEHTKAEPKPGLRKETENATHPPDIAALRR
jgi:hypothetical protein